MRAGAALVASALGRSGPARLGAGLLLFFVLVALVGPLVVADPTEMLARPLLPPNADHWFGTTGQGQDVLAQTVVGTRMSLFVGLATGLLVTALGALVGVTAGYFGGRIDDALSLLVNVFLVLPGLPLAIVLAAWLPPGPLSIVAVLTLTGWAWTARVLRAQTLSLRNKDFVAAALVSGEGHARIMLREILPNMTSLWVSCAVGTATYAIGASVGLEFLGLGDVSRVSWGTNLYWATNDAALLTGSWWTFVPTGLCLALVGFGLTLLNYGLDELTNPRLGVDRAWRRALKAAGRTPGDSTPYLPPAEGGQ